MTRPLVRVLNHELRPSQLFSPAFSLTTLARGLAGGRGKLGAIAREAGMTAAEEIRQRRAWRSTAAAAKPVKRRR